MSPAEAARWARSGPRRQGSRHDRRFSCVVAFEGRSGVTSVTTDSVEVPILAAGIGASGALVDRGDGSSASASRRRDAAGKRPGIGDCRDPGGRM